MRSHLLLLVLCLGAIFGPYSSASPSTLLLWGHTFQEHSLLHDCALEASAQFEEATNSTYYIDIFPDSTVGSFKELNEGLQYGGLDIIYSSSTYNLPLFQPLSSPGTPFIFSDFDHWTSFSSSDVFVELADQYRDTTRHHLVAALYGGRRQIVTRHIPIDDPDDLKGKIITWTAEPPSSTFFRQFGVRMTDMKDFSDQALAEGLVDGLEVNLLADTVSQRALRIEEGQILNLTNHLVDTIYIIVSESGAKKFSANDWLLFNEIMQAMAASCSLRQYETERDRFAVFQDIGLANEIDPADWKSRFVPLHQSDYWENAIYQIGMRH